MEKLIFNAQLQKETTHTLEVDDNNEIVATCTETGRQLKFPNVSEAEFDVLVAKHNESNVGQRAKKPLFGGATEEASQPE
ncbi:MAG TPA: hypothetical protein VD999_05755 [Vitreimonas sp.]|nr:hypothetical protein [Vitreimonas sp.]